MNNVESSPLLRSGRGRLIGLFGGSFNPIHNGHVSLARQMLVQVGLDEVWLMVSPQNPLKRNMELLDDWKRFRMAAEALKHEPQIKACDYELHLPKPSYTWLTLQALRRDFPGYEFVLLIGGDNWKLFPRWYHANDILRSTKIMVYPRRGYETLDGQLPANVSILNASLLDISSTEIRERIKKGESISGMVPRSIENLVKTNYEL